MTWRSRTHCLDSRVICGFKGLVSGCAADNRFARFSGDNAPRYLTLHRLPAIDGWPEQSSTG